MENFEICYEQKLLVDCRISENDRIILPYHSTVYTLSEQEANTLEWNCKKEHFEKCQIIAHSVDDKTAEGLLEVPLLAIRASIRTVESSSEV